MDDLVLGILIGVPMIMIFGVAAAILLGKEDIDNF